MGNDDTDFVQALYNVYEKLGKFFFHSYVLINLFKEKYISSVKSYKYLNKLKVKYKNNGLNFLKITMYVSTIPLLKL